MLELLEQKLQKLDIPEDLFLLTRKCLNHCGRKKPVKFLSFFERLSSAICFFLIVHRTIFMFYVCIHVCCFRVLLLTLSVKVMSFMARQEASPIGFWSEFMRSRLYCLLHDVGQIIFVLVFSLLLVLLPP